MLIKSNYRHIAVILVFIISSIPLTYYQEAVKKYVMERGGRIIQEERIPEYLLVYEIEEQGHSILTKARAVRCGALHRRYRLLNRTRPGL